MEGRTKIRYADSTRSTSLNLLLGRSLGLLSRSLGSRLRSCPGLLGLGGVSIGGRLCLLCSRLFLLGSTTGSGGVFFGSAPLLCVGTAARLLLLLSFSLVLLSLDGSATRLLVYARLGLWGALLGLVGVVGRVLVVSACLFVALGQLCSLPRGPSTARLLLDLILDLLSKLSYKEACKGGAVGSATDFVMMLVRYGVCWTHPLEVPLAWTHA